MKTQHDPLDDHELDIEQQFGAEGPAAVRTKTMNMLQQRISDLAKAHGSAHAAARAVHIAPAHISRMANNMVDYPSEAVLDKLGLCRTVTYALKPEAPDADR